MTPSIDIPSFQLRIVLAALVASAAALGACGGSSEDEGTEGHEQPSTEQTPCEEVAALAKRGGCDAEADEEVRCRGDAEDAAICILDTIDDICDPSDRELERFAECMGYEGTGGSGAGGGSSAVAGTGGGGTCTDPGYDCSASTCCDGSVCVGFEDGAILCAATCSTGSDCASGCCAATDDGTGVCAGPEYCGGGGACVEAGSDCTTQECCSGSTCVDYGNGYGIACGAMCSYGSDCASGCCVALEDGSAVCAPSEYCG